MAGRVHQNASQTVYDVTECLLDNMNEVMSCFFRMGKTIALHVFIRWVWKRVSSKITESVAFECLKNNFVMFCELNAVFRKLMVFHSANHGIVLSVELILQDDVYQHMLRQCEQAKFSDKCFDASPYIVQAVLNSRKRLLNFRKAHQSIQTHVEQPIPEPKSFEERQALALNRAAERVGAPIRKESHTPITTSDSCPSGSRTSHREPGCSSESTRSVAHSSPRRIEKTQATELSPKSARSWERLAKLFHYDLSTASSSEEPSKVSRSQQEIPIQSTFQAKRVDEHRVISSPVHHSHTDSSTKRDPHFFRRPDQPSFVSHDRHGVPNSDRRPNGVCAARGSPAGRMRFESVVTLKSETASEKSTDLPDEGFISSRGSSISRASLRTQSIADEAKECLPKDTDFGVFSAPPSIRTSSRATHQNHGNDSVRRDKEMSRTEPSVGIIGAQRKTQYPKGFKMPEELPEPIEEKRFEGIQEFILNKLDQHFWLNHFVKTYGMDEQSNEMCHICQRQIFEKHLVVQCEACKIRSHEGCDSERKKFGQFWCLRCSYASPSSRKRRNTRHIQISK